LPWKISVKGGACGSVSDAPSGAPLTVIFARRQDARREEDGPVRLRRRGHRAALQPVPREDGPLSTRPPLTPNTATALMPLGASCCAWCWRWLRVSWTGCMS
jgi:hypothetical protein